MTYFSAFDAATGRFTHWISAPAVPDGYPAIVGVFDDQTAYVDLATDPPTQQWKTVAPFEPNKTTITADDTDTWLLIGLPQNTIVEWPDGTREIVNDGIIEFVSDHPGVFSIVVNCVEFIATTYTVIAE